MFVSVATQRELNKLQKYASLIEALRSLARYCAEGIVKLGCPLLFGKVSIFVR